MEFGTILNKNKTLWCPNLILQLKIALPPHYLVNLQKCKQNTPNVNAHNEAKSRNALFWHKSWKG